MSQSSQANQPAGRPRKPSERLAPRQADGAQAPDADPAPAGEPIDGRLPSAERAAAQEPREDDARGRLLAAAGPVFASHGFDRATVREICRDAGVNIASVGYYFGDKFGLYREVFRSIRARCHEAHPVPAAASLDPRQELFELVRHLLAGMLARDDSGWESQLMTREMNHPTEVFSEMVEESFRPLFERLVTTLRALSPTGTPQAVLEQLALSVVGQSLYYRVGAGVVRHLIPADRMAASFTVESLARHIAGVTIAAAEDGLALAHAQAFGAAPMQCLSPNHHPVQGSNR